MRCEAAELAFQSLERGIRERDAGVTHARDDPRLRKFMMIHGGCLCLSGLGLTYRALSLDPGPLDYSATLLMPQFVLIGLTVRNIEGTLLYLL